MTLFIKHSLIHFMNIVKLYPMLTDVVRKSIAELKI